MQSVLAREEEFEAIFSQILASPDSCKKLMDVFYDAMDDNHLLETDNPKHFSKVLFYAYQNGDISALLLKLCGKSMFDLLREAYLIPKRFHGKSGENPVLLTNPEGELLPEAPPCNDPVNLSDTVLLSDLHWLPSQFSSGSPPCVSLLAVFLCPDPS